MADNGAIEQLTVRTLTHVVGHDSGGLVGREPVTDFVRATFQITTDSTLSGGGSLSSNLTLGLSSTSIAALALASSAVQPGSLGSIATQNSNAVSITGGNIAGITDLAVADGGTGASTAANARTNIGAAALGSNNDITSLSGLTTALSVSQGGTGSTSVSAARTSLGAAALGANSDITSLSGLTTALSIAQGGTGSTTVGAVRNSLSVAVRVASIAALQALDTTVDTITYLTATGREGYFVWLAGNYSSLITADTTQGIYVKATAIASTAGAWVRIAVGQFSVKLFGAVGDGTSDDTAAINAAITMAKHIYFPAGTYKTTSAIAITASGYTLQGAGKQVTTIAPAFASGDCFTIGTVAGIDSIAIRGMTIKPTITKTSGASIRLIEIANIIVLDDVYIYGGYNGIAFEANNTNQSIDQQLSNFYIRDCTNVGILCDGGTGMPNDIFLSQGVLSNCNIGMKFASVSGLYIHDVDAVGSTNQGILFAPAVGQRVIFGLLNNVLADTSGAAGWHFNASGTIGNISCTDCWSAGSGGSGVLFSAAVYGMSWKGGIIRNNVQHGVAFAVGGKIGFSEAQIFNNSRTTSAAYDGVNFASGVTDVAIRGCFIGSGGLDFAVGGTNNQRYGINLVASGTSANIIITENNLTGNVTGAMFDGMTLTSKVIKNNLGYQSRTSGTASVAVGNAAIAISHGLPVTPNVQDINIKPITSPGVSGVTGWWAAAADISATQFVIRTSQAVATSALQFSWEARTPGLE
ncbi:hypothetical protein G6M02_08230 [Agrobacterium rhizogenes]|nr:hypothetical protein [Rhizobium rhizogenes]